MRLPATHAATVVLVQPVGQKSRAYSSALSARSGPSVSFGPSKRYLNGSHRLRWSAPVLQKRSYARWSKMLKKLPKATLEQLKADMADRMQGMQEQAADPKSGLQPDSRSYPSSSETVMDKWLPPESFLTNPFTKSFWTNIWDMATHKLHTWLLTPRELKKLAKELQLNHKDFNKEKILAATKEMYQHYHKSITQNNLSDIDFACEALYSELRAKQSKRKMLPNATYLWHVRDLQLKMLNLRAAKVPPPVNVTFVQATVEIKCKQQLKVVERGTNKFIGGTDSWKDVTDYWVVEKIYDKPDSKFVLVNTNLAALLEKEEEEREKDAAGQE